MKLAKIIIFILALSMYFSPSAPATTAEINTNLTVLENDSQKRSVESIVDGIRITATYDKRNHTLTLEYVDVETNEIISHVVCDMVADTVTADGETYRVPAEPSPP